MTEPPTLPPQQLRRTGRRRADSPRMRRRRERLKGARTILLFMLALVVVLFGVEWPWPAHFASGLPAGPDAPRDAWKLWWNARNVLDSRPLPAHNAAAFYPCAGALDFDDPLYVPGLVAVPIYSLVDDPLPVYNLMLLIFWLISALAMHVFLRELGIGRTAAAVGALAFALMPWRTARVGDLAAQLCFGVPLGLMLLTRWVRTQQRRWAFGVGLVVALQWLSSAVYGLALTVALPLVALIALIRRRPTPVHDRPFYSGLLIMAVVPLALVAVLLGPAKAVRTGDLLEPLYAARSNGPAHPLAYVNPPDGSLVDAFSFPVEGDAQSLFPGVAVLLLAGVYGFFRRQMLRTAPLVNRARQFVISVLGVARAALSGLLVIACLAGAGRQSTLLASALVGIIALTLAIGLIAWRRPRAFGSAVMHGLALAAIVCFAMSLGARTLIGPRLFGAFFGTIAPLSGLGIVVLVFLIAAAAWILDEVAHHRRFRWLPVPVLVLVCAESIVLPNRFVGHDVHVDVDFDAGSPVIAKLIEQPGRYTLLALPAGDAETDAHWLLNAAGRFDLMVNGSATITPPASAELVELFRKGDVEAASKRVQELWPNPYLLIDRVGMAKRVDAFPLDETRLETEWSLLLDDERYALYAPAPKDASPYVIRKRLRADFAERNRLLHFKARMLFSDPAFDPFVVVRWNGMGDQRFGVTSRVLAFEFDAIEAWTGRVGGDIVEIELVFKADDGEYLPAEEALDGTPYADAWEVSEIEFWHATRR